MPVRPSRLYLPKLESPPPTILDYLVAHFPRIEPHIWRARVSKGLITLSDGAVLREDSPYRHGLMVFYRKEVTAEPAIYDEPHIVYSDDDIVIVDKPHGIPVTPAGEYLERSVLVWLESKMGIADLAAVHRLDRDTAGLVLFTTKADLRAPYHRLFANGIIEREYLAIAHVPEPPNQSRWNVENRLAPGAPWFRQRIIEGPPNASTAIELIELRKSVGLFKLTPKTGKKHQLRVHMSSIGFPILGDPYYPTIRTKQDGEPPLQLLARQLTFSDPLSGKPRTFTSLHGISGTDTEFSL